MAIFSINNTDVSYFESHIQPEKDNFPFNCISVLSSPQLTTDVFEEKYYYSDTFINNYITYVRSCLFWNAPFLELISLTNCEQIRVSAFRACENLKTIYLPKCHTISSAAFAYCYNLISISLESCMTVSDYAFASCSKLQTVSFPNLLNIGSNAFVDCSNLSNLYMPECLVFNSRCFYNTKVTNLNLSKAQRFYYKAFGNCLFLTDVNAPECTGIGEEAFINCYMLKSFTTGIISNAINGNGISSRAFANCSSLSVFTLNGTASDLRLYSGVFSNCTNLISVYLLNISNKYALSKYVVKLSNSTVFENTPIANSSYTGTFGSIYVPSKLYSYYYNDNTWITYKSRLTSI